MGHVLERKDHTHIYIPPSNHLQKKHKNSMRFAELIIALGLITIGTWIIITI
ncbi:MAG: hypothetical protein KKC68_09160 [Candidatus Thermoplasmatota archaeon]|nr:hypothetical protein [Candidatus Thermoplasmatota archaeon]MBU1941926.1 hypothetical protein [Candidatus Thermoplasmatota archaeon]